MVFITPYLLAEIGAGLGYLWGCFAILTSTWAWFFILELKVSPKWDCNEVIIMSSYGIS